MTRHAREYFPPSYQLPVKLERFRCDQLGGIFVVCMIAAFVGEFVKPHCRHFSWDDATISRPFETSEGFPNWTLPLIVIFPIGAMSALALWFPLWGCPMKEAINWLFFNTVVFTIQFVFVQFLKVFAGRLRPDFLGRLTRAGYNRDSKVDFCDPTRWTRETRDGRLSFPSGHSSTTFGAIVPFSMFLFLYLQPLSHGGSFI